MTNVNPLWMKIQHDETHVVSVRLPLPLVAAIDKWRGQWRGRLKPNRSEAIRHVLENYFINKETEK